MTEDTCRITLHLTALTTVQLRAAIVAHRHAAESTGASIPKTDGDRRPFVGVLPCDKFSMVTLPLTRSGAIDVLMAIENARRLAEKPTMSVDEALAQIVPPLVYKPRINPDYWWSQTDVAWVDSWNGVYGSEVEAQAAVADGVRDGGPRVLKYGEASLTEAEADERREDNGETPDSDSSMLFEDRAVTMADAENTDDNPHPSSPIEPLCCSFHFPTK
jgi:hypothetical protein